MIVGIPFGRHPGATLSVSGLNAARPFFAASVSGYSRLHRPPGSPNFVLQTRKIPAVLFAAVPPSDHVDFKPTALVVHRVGAPGPSTISRPFAARMFIAHMRFGARRDGAPATFTVSPTFKFSGVA